jgi:ATP-binding cassette subfamily C protein LapB
MTDTSSPDPLLDALVFLCRHYERPRSKEVILAGLPAVPGPLSPKMFAAAAEQAGLVARTQRMSLTDLHRFALPAVVPLKDGRACIVVERIDREDSLRVVQAENIDAEMTISLTELAREHTGYVIFCSIRYKARQEDGAWRVRPGNHWFWEALYQDRGVYVQVALAAVMVNLFALASPLFIMNIYDRVVPNNAVETLWTLAIGASVVFGFDFLLRNLRSFFIDLTGKKVDTLLAGRIFEKVLNVDMAARPVSSGSFANMLREMESLRDFFTSATLCALVDLPFVAFFIFVFYLLAGPVALVPLIAVPLVIGLGIGIHYPLSRAIEDSLAEGHHKHGLLVETLNGLETVKTLRGQGILRHRWDRTVKRHALSGHWSRFYSQAMIHTTIFIQQMTYVAIIVVGVYQIQAGRMTQGALVACAILSGRTMAPLGQIAGLLTRLHHAMSAYRMLDRVMQGPDERPLDKNFLHRPDLRGGVSMTDVSFAYPGSRQPALHNITCSFTPGERVAVIGRTGSGKSTMARLITGLYRPKSGMQAMDGTDYGQIDPVDIRGCTGYVPQDVFLFRGTLRENITLGFPHAPDEKILRACALAGVEDFVRSDPEGYDRNVGERGDGLSGGQRQQVAIARALLLDPKLLIMDEPTSSMDSRSEGEFIARMKKILQGRGLLLITHRTSLLELVDRIIVMDQGTIAADGPKPLVLEALNSGKIKIGKSDPAQTGQLQTKGAAHVA